MTEREWLPLFTVLDVDGVPMVVLETTNGRPTRLERYDLWLLRTSVVLDWDGTPYTADERPDLEPVR